MWYIRYTTGPRTNTPLKAARVGADSIRVHFKNIDSDVDGDGIGNTLRRSVQDSIKHIGWMSAMAYAPSQTVQDVEEKPALPNVCVWDQLTAAEKARVAELVGSPE